VHRSECRSMMVGSMGMGSYGAEDTRARCHQLAWSIWGSKMIYLEKWSAEEIWWNGAVEHGAVEKWTKKLLSGKAETSGPSCQGHHHDHLWLMMLVVWSYGCCHHACFASCVLRWSTMLWCVSMEWGMVDDCMLEWPLALGSISPVVLSRAHGLVVLAR
jgi:hypothetical protein